MSQNIPDDVYELVHVAILMAQELQEFVDDAIECGGDLVATRELLNDWEEAFKRASILPRWQDVMAEAPAQQRLLLCGVLQGA